MFVSFKFVIDVTYGSFFIKFHSTVLVYVFMLDTGII